MKKNTRNYKVGQTRLENQKKILEAAEVEFANHGFKGASMSNIADMAELPRANVHYYFKNKQELYLTVLMDIVTLWNDAFNQIKPEDDPKDAIQAYIRAKVMYSKKNPLASKIFANEIIHGAVHFRQYLGTEYREWIRGKHDVIQSWVDQGKMDSIDPFHLIFLIWSSTQYYAEHAIEVSTTLGKKNLTAKDFEAVVDSLSHIIIKGCGIK
ncbi:MAG TPA: TetR/AcrR family transcriptional regulator [Gammaproteobacteria bacterium]|nr:TetR/AcrR family transcriptional regulator [Gammaproteobacteria bacterium]